MAFSECPNFKQLHLVIAFERYIPFFRRAIDFNESYPSVVFKDNYSKHRVPSEKGVPLTVNFSVNLVSIVAVDEPNQVHNLVLISVVSGINVTLRLSIYDKS